MSEDTNGTLGIDFDTLLNEKKVLIDKLTSEVEDLKKRLETIISSNKEVINNLGAQLDASKQLFNDTLNNNFNLKTMNILLQRQVDSLNKPNE